MKLLPALLLCVAAAGAAERSVAITIDDVPRGGDGGPLTLAGVKAMTQKLLLPFKEGKIPVTGFVNTGKKVDFDQKGMRDILDLWLDNGADLGNHGYSHLDLNEAKVQVYKADIVKGEPLLRQALEARGKKLQFFRYPFLFTGPTKIIKRQIEEFLDDQGYRIAPVTFDNSDYMYAKLYMQPANRDRVKEQYLPYLESVIAFFEDRSSIVMEREIPQILLLHASQLNADVMPDLLAMFRKRGYKFISLSEALADPAYKEPDDYVGRGGFSWLHRWAKTKGMVMQGEPEPPAWVTEGWEK